MAKTEKVLTGMEAKIAELATNAYKQALGQLEQQAMILKAKLHQDVKPLRDALGLQDFQVLDLTLSDKGEMTASWDPDEVRPKQPPTGPLPPDQLRRRVRKKG